MTNYIGLTIGPIYKTLQNAKKTRELWAASNIFSHIMKQLIKDFKTREFIIPYVNENDPEFESLLNKAMPIGVFHDRFIFKAEEGDFKLLQERIEVVLDAVAVGIAEKVKPAQQADVTAYVKQYFQLYFCEASFEKGDPYKKINENINAYLDTLELQSGFVPSEEKNFVAEFLKNANKSFLIQNAFGRPTVTFRSIPEIATFALELDTLDHVAHHEIFQNFDKTGDDPKSSYDIYKDIKDRYKRYKIPLRQHHRYIAIVHADGDGMGDAIKNLPDNGAFQKFSKQLFTFDLLAHQAIHSFGGETIFAGGDDLLFFAPVIGKEKTVFDLLNAIDGIFDRLFALINPKPTLSFGISISYYKFPLYEALNLSRHLLSYEAKNPRRGKNAVAFRILKHSGQYFEGFFGKTSPEYKALLDLLHAPGDARMMSGMIHTLFSQKSVVTRIGNNYGKIKNFFKNNFNESIHHANQPQVDQIRELTHGILSSAVYDSKQQGDTIYSALRLNKFMGEKDE